MRSSVILALGMLISSAMAYTPFPLPDGFPKVNNATALVDIERPAGGLLPQMLPQEVSCETLDNLQLIAFQGFFQLAFFFDIWTKILTNSTGYNVSDTSVGSAFVVTSVEHIIAIAQVQLLTINNILNAFQRSNIVPCNYSFPVNTFSESIALAQMFTDVTVGTLIDMQSIAAQNNDSEIMDILGGLMATQISQAAFCRVLQDKVPVGQPFPTISTPTFTFNFFHKYVIPGSCPMNDTEKISFPQLPALNVIQGPTGKCEDTDEYVPTGTCDLHILLSWNSSANITEESLRVVYLNGLINPIVENFTVVNSTSELVVASVPFPVNQTEIYGLTLVVLTEGDGPYNSTDSVMAETKYGPGIIEYDFEYAY